MGKRHFSYQTSYHYGGSRQRETDKKKRTEIPKSWPKLGTYSVLWRKIPELSPALPRTDLHHQSQLADPPIGLWTLWLWIFQLRFWRRQTTRQYVRLCQVIIGLTLVPGRLVNRARVHALALASASRFWYAIYYDQPLGWEYAGRLLNTGRLCQFRLALEYERHFIFFWLSILST